MPILPSAGAPGGFGMSPQEGKSLNIAVVIAAYNEAANLAPLTGRLIPSLDSIPESRWRLIYVIEGADGSKEIVEGFSTKRAEIEVIYAEKPSGLANAFRKGFEAVPDDTEVLVTMDADLNHQPEEIPRLVTALWSRGADIVIGSRKVPGSTVVGAPLWKRRLSDVMNRLMKRLMAVPVADQTSGFRVYRYSAFRRISYSNRGFAFLPEILLNAYQLGLSIHEEPIQFVFRERGASKMRFLATSGSYIHFLLTAFGFRARSPLSRRQGEEKRPRQGD
jgi:glycosyltransferase involved in cell wall biosynthesis